MLDEPIHDTSAPPVGSGGSPPAGTKIEVDAGAAQAASDALRALGASLNEGGDAFGKQLQHVTDQWTGGFREEFDPLAAGYLAGAAANVAGLVALASAIAVATEQALIYNQAVDDAATNHQPPPPRPSPAGM